MRRNHFVPTAKRALVWCGAALLVTRLIIGALVPPRHDWALDGAAAHVAGAFVLSVVLALMLPEVLALLLVLAGVVMLELMQPAVGRHAEIDDVWFGALGAGCAGVVFAVRWMLLRSKP